MPRPSPESENQTQSARQRRMSVLARATAPEIEDLLASEPALPGYSRIRGPETGLAMVRGRADSAGPPFNLGELVITRCTVRLTSGTIGHAYVVGRCGRHAELAAVLDAAMQDPAITGRLAERVLEPLAARQTAERQDLDQKAAATRVEFFSMGAMR